MTADPVAAAAAPDRPEHFDVVIVGAGLSGIGAGCHLRFRCPGKSFVVLEARDRLGGTWDLFRYPGVRSDSDMHTLGYGFAPWREANAIADGASILNYVAETARRHGIDRHIRVRHAVTRASWCSSDAAWTIEVEHGPDRRPVRITCGFLFSCSGYYDYARGYTPAMPGIERFAGQVVHPQAWPDALDYRGKRVVVIGSGATAVTLVPAMARDAAHVTMLQRSPTYVVSRPSEDPVAAWLRRRLPERLAHGLTRWKNLLVGGYFYDLARRQPARVRRGIIDQVRAQLGAQYDVATHFTPRYDPWDQRICLVPDADLFRAIRAGTASVVTDHIESFTPAGLRLRSGAELAADIVVTATGLTLQLMGAVEIRVDGARVDLSRSMIYKGMMFSGVPNLAFALGYTNASWTLKVDLACGYVCRLLRYMDRRGLDRCTPTRDPSVAEAPLLDFTSGYVRRALDQLPRQGARAPWKLHQNYVRDLISLRFGRLRDGAMMFRRRRT